MTTTLKPVPSAPPSSVGDWKIQAFERVLRPIVDRMVAEGIALDSARDLLDELYVERAERAIRQRRGVEDGEVKISDLVSVIGVSPKVAETIRTNAATRNRADVPLTAEGKIVAKWLQAIKAGKVTREVPMAGSLDASNISFLYLVRLAIRGARHEPFMKPMEEKGLIETDMDDNYKPIVRLLVNTPEEAQPPRAVRNERERMNHVGQIVDHAIDSALYNLLDAQGEDEQALMEQYEWQVTPEMLGEFNSAISKVWKEIRGTLRSQEDYLKGYEAEEGEASVPAGIGLFYYGASRQER